MILKEYIIKDGSILLYSGEPAKDLLESLAAGPGDLWHSSLDQGFKGVFPELTYQIAVFWWYLNDIEELPTSVNWRINPHSFVVRKEVWDTFRGFPKDYESNVMSALDLGFRMLRYCGGIPMYVKGLFPTDDNKVTISAFDRYMFFFKNFKKEHALNMLIKEGIKNPISEIKAYRNVSKKKVDKNPLPPILPRDLKSIQGKPTISVVIPTMFRQNYTLQLLKDYNKQSYLVKEIIVIDATPVNEREENIFCNQNFSFELKVIWQSSKGSCRARNEAIENCVGDYIIFADDDTRIPSNFVENHLKLIQTYNVEACNGLDIHAANYRQDLNDLNRALEKFGECRWKVGAAQSFSNANSCVKREWVEKIKGNDVNFDGGYGEDSDFGFSLLQAGAVVLFNPFSANLHLKPPSGGYRHWGLQAAITGKKRKRQMWELDHPVRFIKPAPSPTIMYGILKRFKHYQIKEYRFRYFFLYLFKNPKRSFIFRLLLLPYKFLQFKRSVFYAENLLKRGERFK